MKERLQRKLSFLIVLFLLTSSLVYSQTAQVSGRVTDKKTGEGVPSATIVEKGTTNGVISDLDGNYTIEVAEKSVIVISFIGYSPQEVAVQGDGTFNIELEEDKTMLEEVIMIGYGSARRQDITGAVASVSSEKLLQSPTTSLQAGLQGKVAGVSIQQTTGAPGQKMKLRIRGGSKSINYDNEPLYVIDGFAGADISTISPNDIASIDILKDASATAIYGSNAANGVVIITTSTPRKGDMKVGFEANWGLSKMVNEYEILSSAESAELMNEQLLAGNANATPYFSEENLAEFRERGGTNWADLITQNGTRQYYTLNLSGGSEKFQYFISGNALNQTGVLKHSFYKRYSLRSNLSGDITKWLDFKFNTFGTTTQSQNNGLQTNGVANAYGRAMTFPQQWESRDENGEYINIVDYDDYNGKYQPGQNANPERKNEQNQISTGNSINSVLDLNFKFGKHITLVVSNSAKSSGGFYGARDLTDDVGINRETITAQQKYNKGYSYQNFENLSYSNNFGRHSLKISAIYEYAQGSNQSLQGKVGNLTTLGNEWYVLSNGSERLITHSTFKEWKRRSYMGRLNYSFANRYLLTASIRKDGSSVFQPENHWAAKPFMSFAAGWIISEENFMGSLDWLSNLKLRAGYGETGNSAIDPYDTQVTLDFESNDYIWYTFDNSTVVSGVIPGELTDANIVWERGKQSNIGLDFAVLDGKLSGIIDVYGRETSNQIIKRTIPMYTGQESITSNFAKVSSQGFELTLNWNIIENSDFRWSADFNISRNTSNVDDVFGETNYMFASDEPALGIWNTDRKFIIQEGEPLGSLYGLRSLGLWQEDEAEEAALYNSRPGEPKYEDINGDTAISEIDKQIIGQTAPVYSYGIGMNLAYKNFDLIIQCVGMAGNEIYNYSRHIFNRDIVAPEYKDRWTPTNAGASQQTMIVGNDYSRNYLVSQYVENGAFFKISNLTLGYTLPKAALNAIKISNIRVYVSVDNLYTFTKYTGLDPESSSTPLDSESVAGIDAFSYPLTRTFSGGLKVNF